MIQTIKSAVLDYFNSVPGIPLVTSEDIESKSRKREIVQVRQVSMYLARKMTKFSLSQIGCKIGNKNHATVISACKTVTNLCDTEKSFRNHIDAIQGRIAFETSNYVI